MQLTKENLTQIKPQPALQVPNAKLFELSERVLQFGTGVLLRGLPDYFFHKANTQGLFNGRVVVVKSTNSDSSAFDAQDGLYTLCVRGVVNEKIVEENIINASISRVLWAKTDWKRILECAHNPDMKIIISNTTEVGIELVQDDITDDPPVSFPGKLLAFLFERFKAFNGSAASGMVIIPTELISDNGSKLESIVLELAHRNNLNFTFIEWLENNNTFCNSLVDRIVPGKPGVDEYEKIEAALGYTDELVTMSEAFRLWAIEGSEKLKEILSFHAADEGVVITPDITLFKELKLRLLNGTHTFNCGLAFLAGFDITRQAVTHELYGEFSKFLMQKEISAAIPYAIAARVKADYANSVFERFCNPFIDHQWLSITVQYTSKMKMRNTPLLLRHYEFSKKPPMCMATAFAGFLLFLKVTRTQGGKYFGERNGVEYEIKDDSADYFHQTWKSNPADSIASIVMSNTQLWDTDLTLLPGFLKAVEQQLQKIMSQGVLKTIEELELKRATMPVKQTVIKIHPNDNVIVALANLKKGIEVTFEDAVFTLTEDIPAKHKIFIQDMKAGEKLMMYGVLVGTVQKDVAKGSRMSTENTKHAAEPYGYRNASYEWTAPDVTKFKGRKFNGYYRTDGRVGTANYWLFIPTVFCENRNLDVIREAMQNELGYAVTDKYKQYTSLLVQAFKEGDTFTEINLSPNGSPQKRVFKNVDGIKFLNHQGGCGGIRQDAAVLSKLLAAYADHPNVGGVTVLSLGCQNLQVQDFLADLKKHNPGFDKPLHIFEQQQSQSEEQLIADAIRQTFEGLIEIDKQQRKPASLDQLCLGVKCGGSDGFSGISANPAVGYCADLLVALGGKVLLAEFPELCGVEQELIDRSVDKKTAEKFIHLMQRYEDTAIKAGSSISMNPSPGNIKDGLITDAIKSAGAAKKGGTSPVVDVLDYTETAVKPGLSLVCTPGNDVEATTGKAASGATLILFTTGLGTPTGNPVCPTIKVSTNGALTKRMNDIIDIDCGPVIEGEKTIDEMGEEILEYCIKAASGEVIPKAVQLNQDDFIPWKRGVSL